MRAPGARRGAAVDKRIQHLAARLVRLHDQVQRLHQVANELDEQIVHGLLDPIDETTVELVGRLERVLQPWAGSLRAPFGFSSASAAPPLPQRRAPRRPGEARVRILGEARLTERERQVAVLVARGYTNQQIADTLYVARGTVATHLQHLLDKLNCASRVQVATWVITRGLLDDSSDTSQEPAHLVQAPA